MKVTVNNWFKFETNDGVYNIPYDEAMELYNELHKEFGSKNTEPNSIFYPPGVRKFAGSPYVGDVPNTGYTIINQDDSKVYYDFKNPKMSDFNQSGR